MVDGDTFAAYFLVPFKIRLAKVQAAEIDTSKGKKAATDMVALVQGKVCEVTIHGQDKFGRVLADVREPSGIDAGRYLIDNGFAVTWDGQGQRPQPMTAAMTALGPLDEDTIPYALSVPLSETVWEDVPLPQWMWNRAEQEAKQAAPYQGSAEVDEEYWLKPPEPQ